MQQKETRVEYENSVLSVGDLDVAAMLVAKGYAVVSVDKVNKKANFLFQKTREMDQLIRDYWQGQLDVNALAFATARRDLKSRIFGLDTIR